VYGFSDPHLRRYRSVQQIRSCGIVSDAVVMPLRLKVIRLRKHALRVLLLQLTV
jgi:hypothetical protein